MPSGKVVFYYYTYDRDGNRTAPRSTGVGYTRKRDEGKKRKEAEAYVRKLYESGAFDDNRDVPTLREWIEKKHFWDWRRSDYVRGKLSRSDSDRPAITQGYVQQGANVTESYIIPEHGEKYIDDISAEDLEEWLFSLLDKGLTMKTANSYRSFYSTILEEAARLEVIPRNPWRLVPGFKAKRNPYGAFSHEDVLKLIDNETVDLTDEKNHMYHYMIKLALFTGMRLGEVIGLKTDMVVDIEFEKDGEKITGSYIDVSRAWNLKTGEYTYTKDKESRKVPILPELREELDGFLSGPDRFVFSFDPHGRHPVGKTALTNWLYDRMAELEIDRYDRDGRKKTFHSTRRFFNSELVKAGADHDIIRRFTGHDSEEMTEHYTDYLPEELTAISAAQKRLIDKMPATKGEGE